MISAWKTCKIASAFFRKRATQILPHSYTFQMAKKKQRTISDVIELLALSEQALDEVIDSYSTARRLPIIDILSQTKGTLQDVQRRLVNVSNLAQYENTRVIVVDRETGAQHEMSKEELTQKVMGYAGKDVLYMLHNYTVENGQWVPLVQKKTPD